MGSAFTPVKELQIVQWPHPALTTVAEPVTVFDDNLRKLAAAMIRLMLVNKGIGLAANQVGHPVRLFVAKGGASYVNPEIVWTSDKRATQHEGCLSWPGNTAPVTRPTAVRMRYQTLDGKVKEKPADGLTARCWQHEIDHLDGINLANPKKTRGTNGE